MGLVYQCLHVFGFPTRFSYGAIYVGTLLLQQGLAQGSAWIFHKRNAAANSEGVQVMVDAIASTALA